MLTLNNPDKLNAWSWESTRQLGARADQIRFDERVRAVVLRGEGRAFCAGIDLGMPEDRVTGRSPAEKARNYYEGIRWAHERFKVFAELPQPVVAAVQGYCLGFGFELVLMADIRIAADDAIFALPEAQVGVEHRRRRRPAPGPRGGGRLGQAPGLHRPAHRRRTAERIGHRPGGHDHGRPAPTAMAMAQEIAANAPLAVQSIKRTIDYFTYRGMTEAMRFAAMSASIEFVSEDMPAGYAAKAAKKPIVFEGKKPAWRCPNRRRRGQPCSRPAPSPARP